MTRWELLTVLGGVGFAAWVVWCFLMTVDFYVTMGAAR